MSNERVIDLKGRQVIEHVHGSGEDDALIGLAGLPSEDAGEEGLAHAGITDQHQVGALLQESKVEQTKDAVLSLQAAFVMVEVESVDAGLRLQTRTLEAALDGAALPLFQFLVSEPLDGSGNAEVLGRGFSDCGFNVMAHRREIQLLELLLKGTHRIPFRLPG